MSFRLTFNSNDFANFSEKRREIRKEFRDAEFTIENYCEIISNDAIEGKGKLLRSNLIIHGNLHEFPIHLILLPCFQRRDLESISPGQVEVGN